MTPEGAVLRACLDWLAAKRIYAIRMNTGAVSAEHNGKKRFMRFGVPGCADILAFPRERYAALGFPTSADFEYTVPTWIECKALKGRQSDLQKSFQKQVEAEGHKYILIWSIEDLEKGI
jgi:hypothetical protein